MAESIKIGPITIVDRAHLYEGNTHPSEVEINRANFGNLSIETFGGVNEGLETFKIQCTNAEALQIRGVMKQRQIVWIDTSTNLVANEDFRHRGWYLLAKADPSFNLGPGRVTLDITARKISPNAGEFMEMDYTPGVNDGTEVYSEYIETTPLQIFTDSFATFDTAVWNAAQYFNVTSGSVVASGGDLVFDGHRSTTSYEGVSWIYNKTTFDAPLTLEGHLVATATPAAGQQQELWLTLMRGAPTSYGFPDPTFINYGLIQASWGKAAICRGMYGGKFYNYKSSVIYSATPAFKAKYKANGHMECYLDVGAGYQTFLSDFNTGMTFNRGIYLAVWYATFATPTNYSMKLSDITISEDVNVGGYNVVPLPVNASPAIPVTPTFTRTGADGDIRCYQDPGDDLTFQIDPTYFYTGSVRAYNSNNALATPVLMTNVDEELTTTSWKVENGLVKINYNSGVEFYYSTGGAYVLLNTFTFSTPLRLARPVEISPERVTIQLDRTYWTLERGKQFIRVEHPYDAIGYTRKTCYWHDGVTTTSPAADADVSMTTNFYTNIYSYGSGTCITPSPSQDVRLQLLRTIPGPIKSDKLPAANDTGIGWYLNTITATDPNGSTYNAREFKIKPECVIKIRRP